MNNEKEDEKMRSTKNKQTRIIIAIEMRRNANKEIMKRIEMRSN